MRIYFTFIGGLLWGLVACNPAPQGDVHVTSFTPKGDVEEDFSTIRITFDKPVVPEKGLGEALKTPIFRITPALKTAAHFMDRHTLIIKPLQTMAPATKYTVSLLEPFAAALAERGPFSFVHLSLVVKGLTGADPSLTPTTPEFALLFNQPMVARQLQARCGLLSADKQHAPGLRIDTPDFRGTRIPFTTAEPLKKGVSYTFTCKGLLPPGGTEPQREPFVTAFKVHPTLSVTASSPSTQSVTPDELELSITFSTPVSREALASHIRIAPEAPAFARGWQNQDRLSYTQRLNLKPSTDYTVTIKKGMKDAFGQVLDKPFEMRFSTTDAAPSLSLETGIYAIEADGEGYPVWSRNVHRMDLRCASVPKRKVVALLTSDMNYDPWWEAGSSNLDWRSLALKDRLSHHPIKEAKNKWQLTNLDLPTLCAKAPGRGLYLAEVLSDEVEKERQSQGGYYPFRLLGNVTDLGVLLKVGPASGLVWVSSIAKGEPMPGASVSLYDLTGKKVYSGVTDQQGLLRIPGSTTLLKQPGAGDMDPFATDEAYEYDYYRSQRLIAIVEKGDDFAVVDGNWSNGIQIWNFGVTSDLRSGDTRIRGFIQSDRGIYRPGETVHFKGLVRELALSAPPKVPADTKVEIHVEDVTGASVMETRLKLSEFGGFDFSLTLDEGASLGDYYVNATVKHQTFREQFTVEEFRPVAFEIKEDNPKQVRAGEPMALSYRADYLFGAPVKDAAVSWTVNKQRHYVRFDQFQRYSFSDNGDDASWYPWYEEGDYQAYEFVADGATKTDHQGAVRFTVEDKSKAEAYPERYIVSTSIIDATDQTVTKSIALFAHRTEFYLGLHAQEWVQAVDMPFAVNVVAVTHEGKQIASNATLSLSRHWWVCESKGTYRAESACNRKEEKVWARPVKIPPNGNATERIVPKEGGEYTIRIEATDGRGKRVSASTSVWVIGRGEAFWSGDESARMALIASKDEYLPGETAKLVPRADTAGATLLVTLERNGVLDAFVTKSESSGEGIEIPLQDRYAPNVYASVAMIKGRTGVGDRYRPQFKLGVADLKVSPKRHRLTVKVATDKSDFEPGDTVKGKITVTSADGDPVRAEVSLSAADEGILQLIDFKTPDPMKSFFASWGLGVENSTNWNRIARIADPSDMEDEYGADSGGGAGDRIRSRFVSSAFWAPALVTDEKGEIAFELKAPDNLTAFRLMAVAADKGDRFGSGESRFRVNKKLLVKPVLPRFFNQGDTTNVGVVVHNYTDADGEAEVTATLDGLWTRTKVKRAVVKKGGSARVDFLSKVGRRDEALVRFRVKMGPYSDGFELRLPVRRPLSTARRTVGEGKGDDATIPISWPQGTLEKESALDVVVDRTGLSAIEGSLLYLIRYPYGCLEQTLSGLVPLFKVQDLAKSLKLEALKGAKLDTYIRMGVAKVLRHQHPDGHFSLWPGSETHPHLTAYALWGLGEAKRAGVRVSESAITRGLDALSSWVSAADRRILPGGESATMAMAAFVLADNGRPDAGLDARLFEARASLPVYGKAFLLRALFRADGPKEQVDTLKDEILAQVVDKGENAIVQETGGNLTEYWSSDIRTTAMAITALIEVARDLPVIDRLVNGLKGLRLAGDRWGNTQENVYALTALAAYAREASKGSVEVTLAQEGAPPIRKRLAGGEVLRWHMPLDRLAKGSLSLRADRPVWYRATLTTVKEADQTGAVDNGFVVTRDYLDVATEQPVTKAKVGRLIKVRLQVTMPEERHYVALVDPLPAGCEAVNSRLATEVSYPGGGSPSWSWGHQELRDDAVMAFADYFPAGSYTLTYLLRATVAGLFTAAPAHAEEMYAPEVFGATPANYLVVR